MLADNLSSFLVPVNNLSSLHSREMGHFNVLRES